MNKIIYNPCQGQYDLLKDCTVRIKCAGEYGNGSGFFVAPGLILTCFHVIEGANTEPNKLINIFWQSQAYTAEIEKSLKLSNKEVNLEKVDLALLRLKGSVPDHPCVYLDISARPGDNLYSYGYTELGKEGEATTLYCEGTREGTPRLLKLKAGLVSRGASGSPLLNLRTTKVCGIIQWSRHIDYDIGGLAVPTEIILDCWPELIEQQEQFHQNDSRWKILLPSPIDRTAIKREFEGIIRHLDRCGAYMGKYVPPAAEAGVKHLLAAADLKDDPLKKGQELSLARQRFMSLISLDDKDKMKGVTGEQIENKFIVVLGHWGNFRYFDLLDDKLNAAREVYEFFEQQSDIDLIRIFPSKLFSKDYAALIEETNSQLEISLKLYEAIQFDTTTNTNLQIAGKAVAVAAGVGLSVLFRDPRWAIQVPKILSWRIPESKDEAIHTLKQNNDRLKRGFENYFTELREECKTRLQELDKKTYRTDNLFLEFSDEERQQQIKDYIPKLTADYTKLQDLLRLGKWLEADFETLSIMLKIAGREQEGNFDFKSLNNFPCADLCKIDQLWTEYSNGHFGFGVQRQILDGVMKQHDKPHGGWMHSLGRLILNQEKTYLEAFGEQVGWRDKGFSSIWMQSYIELTFSLDAPRGHFPTLGYGIWKKGVFGSIYIDSDTLELENIVFLLHRFTVCNSKEFVV